MPKIRSVEEFVDELETRAADEQQREFLERYLTGIELPANSSVLEIGCGSGAVSRRVARWPGVTRVDGLDVSAALLEYARGLSVNYFGLNFIQGDARQLALAANQYDLVLLHCVLNDIDEPGLVLAEALRVLAPGGTLLVFEADFASLSYATSSEDPVQGVSLFAARQAARDPFLARRLPTLVRREGFQIVKERVFSYAGGANPQYLLELFDRGAQALAAQSVVGPALADALQNELRRRVAYGVFPGSLNYVSVQARKPCADLGSGI